MSDDLLRNVSRHLSDGGVLDGYSIRYYKWTDEDLNGAGNVALFKMNGTFGQSDSVAQMPDVRLSIITNPDGVRDGDAAMLSILRYVRANYTIAGEWEDADLWDDLASWQDVAVFNIHPPLGGFTGPTYLSNGRAMFDLVLRCGVEDH